MVGRGIYKGKKTGRKTVSSIHYLIEPESRKRLEGRSRIALSRN